MQPTRASDVWWKNAVIYCLDVERSTTRTATAAETFKGSSSA